MSEQTRRPLRQAEILRECVMLKTELQHVPRPPLWRLGRFVEAAIDRAVLRSALATWERALKAAGAGSEEAAQ